MNELYDELWDACPDFSRYNPGARHRRRWITRSLEQCRPSSVLDVGCGTGELLRELRAALPGVRSWAGVDLSAKTMIANARRDSGAAYETLDIEAAALSRRFDAVVCTEVLEHLARPRAALANLFTMVEPGGHLVLTCPTGKVHPTERHFGHVAHPTPQHLRDLLAEAGFAIERFENWGFPTYVALKYATNVAPRWSLANFASGPYSARAKAVSTAVYLANFLNLKTSSTGCQLLVIARRPR